MMSADGRAPAPTNPWSLTNLPIVVGWADGDRPLLLAGPPSKGDPWEAGDEWRTVHVVTTQVADNIDRRGGKEATLRRLAATARAHEWRWLPVATARADGSHHALGVAVHGLPRATAVDLARGAGQGVVLELGPDRLRIIDLLGGQISTVRRHHLPRDRMPRWLTASSELLYVWRGRHREALGLIGAGSDTGAAPTSTGRDAETPARAPSCGNQR